MIIVLLLSYLSHGEKQSLNFFFMYDYRRRCQGKCKFLISLIKQIRYESKIDYPDTYN